MWCTLSGLDLSLGTSILSMHNKLISNNHRTISAVPVIQALTKPTTTTITIEKFTGMENRRALSHSNVIRMAITASRVIVRKIIDSERSRNLRQHETEQ